MPDTVPSLSVLIPVLNEQATLESLLARVEAQEAVSELVIVDDGSTDQTPNILSNRAFAKPTQVITHPANRGKGAALRAAIARASSDLAVVQDADLEYDPADYAALLKPFERGDVTVVYGSRRFSSQSAYSFWFVMGNKLVTLWTNLMFNTYISDMETCFKVIPVALWRTLDLQANRFDIEPEMTAKLLLLGERIFEVPISYAARSREEGKKLTWRDGLSAIATLTRLRVRGWRPPA